MRLIEHKFVKRTSSCWLWEGYRDKDGYGQKNRCFPNGTKKRQRVHRIAHEQEIGPIPAGLHVCHKCDIRNCVNPDHLFLGTHFDNMHDMIRKGRYKPPPKLLICKRGHHKDGRKFCRQCQKFYMRKRRAMNKMKILMFLVNGIKYSQSLL